MNSSRRETTPSSELRAEPEDQDSMSKPSEVNSRRRSTVEKINPIKAEIEEFFASAEKDLQKHFTEKYVHARSLQKPRFSFPSLQFLSNQPEIRN